MKQLPSPTEHVRFSGSLRHYHRSGSQAQRSWDDWVDGPSAKARTVSRWPKIAVISAALLSLAGIVTGLIIELG